MQVSEFQALIERIYGGKDRARGTAATFMWFCEEVGELSQALRRGSRPQLEAEFADVFAWLATLASMHDVDLTAAVAAKYGDGCPRCHAIPCACHEGPPAETARPADAGAVPPGGGDGA